MNTSVFQIEQMSCAACSSRVERVLLARPDVAEASVNLATGRARVRHDGPAAELAEAITRAGYPARAVEADAPPATPPDEAPALRRAFLTALALTLPLFIIEMGGHLYPPLHHALHARFDTTLIWATQAVLAGLVLAGPGRVFFRHGIPALLRGAPEMNALVVLGTSAAYLYSLVATFAPALLPEGARHVYFEAAAVIVTLILLGRWLEARAKGRAGAAIRALVALTPATALVLRGDDLVETEVAHLLPGDIVQLRAGERIACDGIVREGSGAVDESMLTGEPLPVTKSPGDPVTGGTLNTTRPLQFEVTAIGSETRLAQIIALVQDAQATRLPVQALVDRVVRVFVPVVMALSALSFVLWMIFAPAPAFAPALVAAISVLIIACPCAMGLAVPVSILVGTGRAAELGILFRRGDALQRLAQAKIVAFDKTGTLTEGRPALVDVKLASGAGLGRNAALGLAARAEAGSDHPLALALRDAAAEVGALSGERAREADILPGKGLRARLDGHDIVLGNRAALAEIGLLPDPALPPADAATPVFLARDGVHVATLSLADPIRPQASRAVEALHQMGLSTALMTGDVEATAQHVGTRLGLGEIHAALSPEDKLSQIRNLGAGSVFVGDGINDAPALAGAETGIAIGAGTDIAVETAEVVLMRPEPALVAQSIGLSRAVMRNIRQNLFWAFAYNVALIPVAMGVLVPFGGPQLSPMLGAAAMAMSSVFVVTNALRLRRFGVK